MSTLPEDTTFSNKPEHWKNLFSTDAAKQIALIVVTGLVLLSVLWIWKSIEIRNILAKDAAERQQFKEEAIGQIQQSHKNHLKLLAKSFVWVVRDEIISGKLSRANLYVNDMLKEDNIQKVTITDGKGIVVFSTAKREQGKEFAIIGDPVYLLSKTTMVDTINDSTMIVSSPIMGFNSRLGTLIITYSYHLPAFN